MLLAISKTLNIVHNSQIFNENFPFDDTNHFLNHNNERKRYYLNPTLVKYAVALNKDNTIPIGKKKWIFKLKLYKNVRK